MTLPKFKIEQDEMLWDCLFDVTLSKYNDCFEKVRKQFYNHTAHEDGTEIVRKITNDVIQQTSNQFISQKPEYQ